MNSVGEGEGIFSKSRRNNGRSITGQPGFVDTNNVTDSGLLGETHKNEGKKTQVTFHNTSTGQNPIIKQDQFVSRRVKLKKPGPPSI
jgi:hypothetical protein